jgi:hypothetical protein
MAKVSKGKFCWLRDEYAHWAYMTRLQKPFRFKVTLENKEMLSSILDEDVVVGEAIEVRQVPMTDEMIAALDCPSRAEERTDAQ